MKSTLIAAGMAMSFGLLFAGGNVSPIAPISEPGANCYPDNVYIEKDVQLMWQDQKYTDKEDGAYKKNRSYGKVGNWHHAMNYCKKLNYAGYSDWRLPTSDELQRVHRLLGEEFRYHRGQDFWSSTPASSGKYYVVFAADGYRYEHGVQRSDYIRCVRCTVSDIEK